VAFRRVCTWVVPAVLAGGLAAPALATGPAAPVLASAGSLPGAVLSVGPDGAVSHRDPAAALTAVRDHSDTRAWLRSIADATRAAAGPAGMMQPLLLAPPPEPDDDAEPEPAEPWAYALPGGDLDGDGRADVLTYSTDGTDFVVEARRGADGDLLWSLPFDADAAFVLPLGRDVTGDRVDDLWLQHFAFTGSEQHEAGPDGETWTFSARLERTYGVTSGLDGAPLWSRQADGELVETLRTSWTAAGVAYDSEYQLRSTNVAVLALPSADVTGDGLDDLVVSEIDLDIDEHVSGVDALVAGAAQVQATLRSSTRGLLVGGATGDVRMAREATGQPAISLLLPVGHVVGSPAADLGWVTTSAGDLDLVCAGALVVGTCLDPSETAGSVALDLVDGASGETAWSSTVPGFWGWIGRLGADVDADGTDDLVAEVDSETSSLVVLSGRSGSRLWEASSSGFPPFLVGIGRGAQGLVAVVADVVFVRGDLADPGGRLEVLLERRDARTGTVLTRERRPAPVAGVEPGAGGTYQYMSVFVGGAPDGDGDGADELYVGFTSEAASYDAQGELVDSAARSQVRYDDLVSGRQLYAESTDDVRVLLPTADLDGDGLLDVRRDVLLPSEDWWNPLVATTAMRLVDRGELWQRTGSWWDAPMVADDQDGVPGVELVHARPAGDGYVVDSLRGRDLGLRWSLPARARR
jgi:hypothetical protein